LHPLKDDIQKKVAKTARFRLKTAAAVENAKEPISQRGVAKKQGPIFEGSRTLKYKSPASMM
jgi:hypothetical protein